MFGGVLGIVAGFVLGPYFRPDDYFANWYGWVANFGAHVALMLIGLGGTLVVLAYFDAVPMQWDLAIQGIGFSVGFQAVQWWQGGTLVDSLDDAFVMAFAWAAPCMLFKVGADNLPKLQSLSALALTLAVVTAHGLGGVWLRVRQARQLERDQ